MEYIRTPKVENVQMLDNHSRHSTNGTLYLTATHLIFVNSTRKKEMWLLHSHIQNIEKLNLRQNGSPLRIRCKTFQVLIFLIKQERDCHDLYSSLIKLSRPVKMEELYAFSYNPRENQLQSDGWDLFSLNNDYLQMGLPTRYWKVSRINNEFSLCETYPKLICVPSLATPALMLGSAAFRSKRRLPVLSYLHRNGSVIVRCSQPMSGFNSRSVEDEAFVDLIRRSKAGGNDFMYIIDTRPMINAMANRAQGKGYENTDFYENIKYCFLGIDNIHVMRNSLNKMLEASEDSNCSTSTWLEALNNSGWLKHVYNVIQVSRFIANAVGVENRSVLVHCSDGWDRTAQTCALSAIMLCPHYRTIDGFLAVVQKEWLHFGHKFEHRCGHLDGDTRETSPVFTQFIDAVWQLMRLRPTLFQFNEQFLFDLIDHVYSCQFGTFLGNCAKERQDCSLATRTYSLWAWMMKRMDVYLNPLYRAAEQHRPENQVFLPPKSPHFVKYWIGLYNRFDKGLQPRESAAEAMKFLNTKAANLSKSVNAARKQRDLMCEKLGIDVPQSKTELNSPNSGDFASETLLKRLEIDDRLSSSAVPPRPVSDNNLLSLDESPKIPSSSLSTQSEPDLASLKNDSGRRSIADAVISSKLVVSYTANSLLSSGGDTNEPSSSPDPSSNDISEIFEADKASELSRRLPDNDVLAN